MQVGMQVGMQPEDGEKVCYQPRSGFGSIITGAGAAGAGSCFTVLQAESPSTSTTAVMARTDRFVLFICCDLRFNSEIHLAGSTATMPAYDDHGLKAGVSKRGSQNRGHPNRAVRP